MQDKLLSLYQKELAYFRKSGAEFANKHPKIASKLLLEPDKCEDPHIERLIEAFAFLTARTRLKIDDELPEITESFISTLYPHLLAPIPSMSIVQMVANQDQSNLNNGYKVPQGTTIFTRPVQGFSCKFRSCYDVTIWPLEIISASIDSPTPINSKGKWAKASLRINLQCQNELSFSQLEVDKLRFYIDGDNHLVYYLYELIFNQANSLEIHSTNKRKNSSDNNVIKLSIDNIKPVGFELDESILPFKANSFVGYRLLSEYFAFPEKFLFFDITGLEKVDKNKIGNQFSIVINLENVIPPNQPLDENTFRLGCSPIINLFKKSTEPIHLNHKQYEYHIVPDVHRPLGLEIYSIDSVTSFDTQSKEIKHYQPFYSLGHVYEGNEQKAFWYTSRRASQRANDNGTEIDLSLVDLNFDPALPTSETLVIHTTCSNRDLPSKLPVSNRFGDFEIENTGGLVKVRALKKLTETLRPPLRHRNQWRLISHLNLNHLSIVGDQNGEATALKEILYLYDYKDSPSTRKQINGIRSISSRRVYKQIGNRVGTGFVGGIETTIELDEEQFIGGGLYLFASVLERFLALYASINSFNQLVVKTIQREERLAIWKPRAGQQIIL